MIKRVQRSLKFQKNKSCGTILELKDSVAEHIHIGYNEIDFETVTDHLFKHGNLVTVDKLLEDYCELIINKMPYFFKHKDCPDGDIHKVASTLIFAPKKCEAAPDQLVAVRKVFEELYGSKYVITALELLPGNLVNFKVIKMLSNKLSPNNDERKRLVDEIIRDYCLPADVPSVIAYTSKLQQLGKEENCVSRGEVWNANDAAEVKDLFVDPASTRRRTEAVAVPSDSYDLQVESGSCRPKSEVAVQQSGRKSFSRKLSGKRVSRSRCMKPRPNHVHPMLPDYDEMAENFTALRKKKI
ncbi:hypothetical protein Tsubulata_026540 [Turnera subulata]|uniref:Uncharacterized protein n=1 Tax=Turnera subulata TaxID=218843 RepID=A0A9Q0FH75_9ROSI|nr:hypothetical protein Tsubulata_026540 [Turnera subulata]